MRKLLVIGIGSGDPEHLTVQAIRALNRVDVFFAPDKGAEKESLLRLRVEICERYIESRRYRFVALADPVRDPGVVDYAERVEAWHAQRAARYEQALASELGEDECGAFLVWGDPALYDSTLRLVERILARGQLRFTYEVIPGISSPQVLAARHRIPLNRVGSALRITTGRLLRDDPARELAEDALVMLDGECAFKTLPPGEYDIYWGAFLGMPQELLVAGEVGEVASQIERLRDEARAREGWIMDSYLLRKRRS
jgi:precorrin-6A synthase